MKNTEVISEGKNEIIEWWSDTLTLENNKIIYFEHMFMKNGQEFESWIEFEDNYNDELIFPLLKNYLVSIKDNRIEKLKIFLKKLNINYSFNNWDTWNKDF